LVLDMQRFFCEPEGHAFLPAARLVAPQIERLCQAFRESGSPVLFTRHALGEDEDPGRMGDWWRKVVREGQRAAELSACVTAAPGDAVLRKSRYDAFDGTELGPRLAQADINTLVICGVMTHLCCETTAREAFRRGLYVWLAADGTASVDEALHLGALRSLAHGFAHVEAAEAIIDWRRSQGGAGAAPKGRALDAPATRALERPSADLDLVVVGAGPAGLAAAVQAVRQGLAVRLLERAEPGGLLRNASRVENYLGAGWQSGPELVGRIFAHARQHGVVPEKAEVRRVRLLGRGRILVEVEGQEPLFCRAVVLATGTAPCRAGFEGEQELAGALLCYGVADLLDGWAKPEPGRAIVVGAGDAALDQAINLRGRGWQVEVLMRGERPRALGLLQRRAAELEIPVLAEAHIDSASVEDGAVRLCWRQGGKRASTARVDRVLVAVGRRPCFPRIEDGREREGPQVIAELAQLKELMGIYPAGDIQRGRYRQAAMATGDGIEAAMRVARELGADSEESTP